MPLDESVLCIPTTHMLAVGAVKGFLSADDTLRSAILDERQFSFRPRVEVETDPTFLQLIPYIVLRCGNLVFQYRRGKGATEKRLSAKRSLGIGGHISTDDAAGGADPYRTGMLRELSEEVDLQSPYTERFLGFIHDNRTPVGSVHLGVVHVLDLEEPLAKANNDEIAEGGFQKVAELMSMAEEFESWSIFLLEIL